MRGCTTRLGTTLLGALFAVGMAWAQVDARTGPAGGAPAEATAPKTKLSESARAALAGAKELEGKVKGLEGPAQVAALQAAATAYDKVAADFAAEAAAAAQAAFTAAELWRRQGSPALAEQDFLLAARLDGARYGQRGRLGAADMQRRLERDEDALRTYGEVAAIDPASARAQTARLWQGRLLQKLGRLDEAVAAFRAALESTHTARQVVDASNYLARALIDKGDLDGAQAALTHAETAVTAAIADDPEEAERLQKALESMPARKALQRARDKQGNAAGDAKALEAAREGR